MGDNRYLALRKMLVNVNYRGKSGIAKKMMDSLVSHARNNNVREIYLGTIGNFKGALRFYEKNGFLPVSKSNLPPNFPVMEKDNLFYCLRLSHNL
ncbi:MAG: GNAT family N-acetyltransferase [Mastigocoleus sp. MO_167.B18]|nr:GNAT family N-acetyltransferase [Mastigocoleus sp. MO_167.B18]